MLSIARAGGGTRNPNLSAWSNNNIIYPTLPPFLSGSKEEIKDTLHLTRTVVFLTNDSNLRVKAHSYNLAVQNIADFVSCAKL